MSIDGPEGPGDGDGRWQITFRGREGIGSGSTLEEEESEEDKGLCPNPGMMSQAAHTERVECGDDDENGGPSMVKRERKVDKEFVTI